MYSRVRGEGRRIDTNEYLWPNVVCTENFSTFVFHGAEWKTDFTLEMIFTFEKRNIYSEDHSNYSFAVVSAGSGSGLC